MKHTHLIIGIVFLTATTGSSQSVTSVQHDSPNHTTIVIHNTSPEAYAERNQRAAEARRRLDEKRRRQHELELARIEAETRRAEARAKAQSAPLVYRKPEYRPAPFMNGGRPTLGGWYGGFGGFGVGNFGYGRSFAPRFRPVRSRRCR